MVEGAEVCVFCQRARSRGEVFHLFLTTTLGGEPDPLLPLS